MNSSYFTEHQSFREFKIFKEVVPHIEKWEKTGKIDVSYGKVEMGFFE
jgi:hypothetical protein